MRGFLVGTLALAILQTVLKGESADRTAGLLGYVGTFLSDLGDPSKPGLPDRRAKTSTPAPAPPAYTPPTTPGGVGTVTLPPGGVSYTPPMPNPAQRIVTA